ncbi:unnamed protein product [Candida verbasci]|uniref:2,5-diamino-6-ribosylamino-4(3H)-pyrimidinone 5'-phosphate reductase n=1 Tax=Candida verbasci TaxID=1227364 RepID=A0A9W4TU57_9ASCO|nr:unnamed protein product [Candida verbasci]
MSLIPLPQSLIPFLESYLPTQPKNNLPFVTLTFAQSLDSKISAKPGIQTKLSHIETKTMTHYLRSNHDSILIGIGTVISDDPKLNNRFNDKLIRPIIIDPFGKFNFKISQLYKIVIEKKGLAPFLIIDESTMYNNDEEDLINKFNGKVIKLPLLQNRNNNWNLILSELYKLGLNSIMIEGGATIINELLLQKDLINSLIITIAPIFLGVQGISISPDFQVELKDIKWWTGIQDSILCSRIK